MRPPSRQKPPPLSLVLEQPAAEAASMGMGSGRSPAGGWGHPGKAHGMHMPGSELAVVVSESDSDSDS